MNWQIVFVLIVVAATVALFVAERFRVDLVALMAMGRLSSQDCSRPKRGYRDSATPPP